MDLSRFRQAIAGLSSQPITRFAPSPTGYLHLGHVASAIYVWGLGRLVGARILLRIEDHDQGRSRLEYEDSILEDLEWLGFEWDEGVRRGNLTSDYRQSQHPGRYEAALDSLRSQRSQDRHRIYGCDCSRRVILQAMGGAASEELVYPGTCRNRRLSQLRPNGIRLRTSGEIITFEDLLIGRQEHDPGQQCGDLLLMDREGQWTYQFAVAVDDLKEGINLVIRGEDILRSTGRQIMIASLLGRENPPLFGHHPLIINADGRKLSKRDRSESIASMRSSGVRPEIILGRAAHAVGLLKKMGPIQARQIPDIVGGSG